MRKYKLEHGIRSDLFICSIRGSHLQYYAFNKYLSELSQRVLGRKITTHALRHTAASLLIADGVPLEVVSRMLGHEKLRHHKRYIFTSPKNFEIPIIKHLKTQKYYNLFISPRENKKARKPYKQ